ncbi:MAG TPA: peroxidase-related enzyme [Pseudonocardia sp.]|jgi:uncharacterized peroxidase-related enzyme|nr:peroxidase-related enzyme [Pseudonocardia sp.]
MSTNAPSWYFPAVDGDVPDRLKSLFRAAEKDLGFAPNVFRAYGYRPERMSAWFAHYHQLHEPTENLSAADREMIAVVVSSLNNCTYCMVSHGATLREELGDPELGERIGINWRHAGLDPKRYAICEYAEKITVRPNECTPEDLKALSEFGLTDEELWDVVELAAMYAFTNRLASATGQQANREYYYMGREAPSNTGDR